jgi:hypothetical protein
LVQGGKIRMTTKKGKTSPSTEYDRLNKAQLQSYAAHLRRKAGEEPPPPPTPASTLQD